MVLTLADRILARDESVLDEVRELGALWRVIHLTQVEHVPGTVRMSALLQPEALAARIAAVQSERSCTLLRASSRVVESLCWAAGAPALGTLAVCGVGLSPRPEDVAVRLDGKGKLLAVFVGSGHVAVMHEARSATARGASLLAPWVGDEVNDALHRIADAAHRATATDVATWHRLMRGCLLEVRRVIRSTQPLGVASLGEASRHIDVLAPRLRPPVPREGIGLRR